MKHLNFTMALALLLCSAKVLALDVTIGYQTGIEPAKVAIADGEYEKATGTKISWRRFDNGAELIRALASGDVDIGNVGSSIVATAASRNLPIQIFLVAAELGISEALVVRNGTGIEAPNDLPGKTIAVPFASTSHYSLLSALKHWNIDPKKVKIISLRVAEITAAWQRGDIDGAYVWEPALGKIKESGKILATSANVAEWGAPTFDLWIVRNDFADKNSAFLAQFAKISLAKYVTYYADPKLFSDNTANLEKIARVTGAKTSDIRALLGGDKYPLADEQERILSGEVAQALANTASFLKAQGKLDVLLPDYRVFATDRFVRAAQ